MSGGNGRASLLFKIATGDDELAQVHRLNYRTFVEEIPQHRANPDGVLVDRFDHENTYFIAKHDDQVVGMISLRCRRPFSLDEKLPGLDAHLPPGHRVCEIPLLAVEPAYRNGVVFHGLMRELARFGIGLGFDAAVISGTTRQLRLYEHVGFTPFGPRVGTQGAEYQPMYLTLARYRDRAEAVERRTAYRRTPISFLPGPVDLAPPVRRAHQAALVSHRGDAFRAELLETKALLRQLTGAACVEVLLGSGTAANDTVAAQIAALEEPGLVLANGEFGERLRDHASRARLRFTAEHLAWGEAFDAAALARAVTRHPDARWLWIVHHETSTGVLNDIVHAGALCRERGMRLCCDCISSIGVVPLDLSRVHLATGVSGKGLGAVAGLALVFHNGGLRSTPFVPRYLDLNLYAGADGGKVPFTQSSALVAALRVAAEQALASRDGAAMRERSAWLRRELRALGLEPLAPDAVASPAIVTLAFARPGAAERLGDALSRVGLETSYRSDYLRARNWLQVAVMGECSRHKLALLMRALRDLRPEPARGP